MADKFEVLWERDGKTNFIIKKTANLAEAKEEYKKLVEKGEKASIWQNFIKLNLK